MYIFRITRFTVIHSKFFLTIFVTQDWSPCPQFASKFEEPSLRAYYHEQGLATCLSKQMRAVKPSSSTLRRYLFLHFKIKKFDFFYFKIIVVFFYSISKINFKNFKKYYFNIFLIKLSKKKTLLKNNKKL